MAPAKTRSGVPLAIALSLLHNVVAIVLCNSLPPPTSLPAPLCFGGASNDVQILDIALSVALAIGNGIDYMSLVAAACSDIDKLFDYAP